MDFAVPADFRIKVKESEKKDKYLDPARELNMKVPIIPIGISAFGTVTKGLLKGPEDLQRGRRAETTETITLLRTARVLRKSWRLEETCCHSNYSERSSANTDVKNSQRVNNNNNNYKMTTLQ